MRPHFCREMTAGGKNVQKAKRSPYSYELLEKNQIFLQPQKLQGWITKKLLKSSMLLLLRLPRLFFAPVTLMDAA